MDVIMKHRYSNHKIWVAASVGVLLLLTGAALAVQVVHNTGSASKPGAFSQTVLEGSESAPQIQLDSYKRRGRWLCADAPSYA